MGLKKAHNALVVIPAEGPFYGFAEVAKRLVQKHAETSAFLPAAPFCRRTAKVPIEPVCERNLASRFFSCYTIAAATIPTRLSVTRLRE